jgi:uncharacterized membrane protein YdjX (TVP38/TMEM64 family)
MKLGILTLLVIVIFLVFKLTPLSVSDFKPENIRNFITRFGPLSPIIFIIIYAMRAVILVMPVGVMSLAGGLAFGKWLGTLYILIGATLGSCFSFLIARYLGRGFIDKLGVMRKGRLKSFDEGVEKNGFRVILFMRLIPLFQYDAVNFGSGLSKMKFRDYAIGSFIGMLPGGFINAFLGSSLENPISIQFFVALGFFILLLFIPTIYMRVKRKKEGKKVTERIKPKESVGGCPMCHQKAGPLAILSAWDKMGRFICPSCGVKIRFRLWFIMILLLGALLFGVERLLNYLLTISFPTWLSFTVSFLLATVLMMIIPMVWKYRYDSE